MKNFKYSLFKENRLVNLEVLAEGASAAANLANAAAKLINLASSVLEGGISLVSDTYAYAKQGAKDVIKWATDPGPPSQLEEYDKIRGLKLPPIPGNNPFIKRALEFQKFLVHLDFKTNELNYFYLPCPF